MPHNDGYSRHVFVGCLISFLISFGVSRAVYLLKTSSEESSFARAERESYEKIEENRKMTKILKALADKDAKWPAIQTIKAVLATPDGARQGVDKIVSFAEVIQRTPKEDRATFVSTTEWEGMQKLADGGELPLLIKLRDAKLLAPAVKGDVKPFNPPPRAIKSVYVSYVSNGNSGWIATTWIIASIVAFIVWFGYYGKDTQWKSIWVVISIIMTAPVSFPAIFVFAVVQLIKDSQRFLAAIKNTVWPFLGWLRVALYRFRLLRRLPAPIIGPLPNQAEMAPSRPEPVVEEDNGGILWYVVSHDILLGRRHLLVKNNLQVYPISINVPRKLRGLGVRAADLASFERVLGISIEGVEDSETDIERTIYRSYVRQKNKFNIIGFGKRIGDVAKRVLKAVCAQERFGTIAFVYEEAAPRNIAGYDIVVRCLDGRDNISHESSFGSAFGFRSSRGRLEGATSSVGLPHRKVRDEDGNILAIVKDRTIFLLWAFWKNLDENWVDEALARILRESIAFLSDVSSGEIDDRDAQAWRNGLSANRDRYVDLCIGRIESEKKGLHKAREKCEREIKEAGLVITEQIRVRHGINAQLEAFEAGRMEDEKAHLAREFDQLAASRCVVAIWAHEDRIQVDTRTVFIEYEGATYRIGRFAIVLNNNGNVSFVNRDGAVGDTYHPHIRANGEPCLGNITEAVSKMMADRQYAAVVSLLFRYLESYNSGSPYARIEKWKRVTKEQS